MRFKKNTSVFFNSTILRIIEAWELVYRRRFGIAVIPEVTSGNDGTHSAESGHNYNRSLDTNSQDLPSEEVKLSIVAEVQEELGPDYFVFLEDAGQQNEHFHTQRFPNTF